MRRVPPIERVISTLFFRWMSGAALGIAAIGSLLAAWPVRCEPPPGESPYVTREEYDKLLREQKALRQELEEMKRERARDRATTAPASTAPLSTTPFSTTQSVSLPPASDRGRPAGGAAADAQAVDRRELIDLRRDVSQLQHFRTGFDQFLLGGDAQVGFQSFRHGQSTFGASISPLILWRPVDKLLFESAFDIGIDTDPASGSSSTSFDLTIANVSYEVNDYLLLGGGLFVVPFGVYHNHFDPPWINKFPDDPPVFSDGGLAPSSEVGLFARGALPAGAAKITYDVYLTNGPSLNTRSGDSAGSLNFADFRDLNGNKAIGGRIGIIPIPELEAGYSIQVSEPNPSGFNRVHALLQALDVNYRPEIAAIGGVLDLRAEYVWSDVSKTTYDPTGALGFGPIRFANQRQGGYLQLGYRPTKAASSFLRKLEFVGRFDFLNSPLRAPGGEHEHRWTIGIDYWLASNAVFKIAYEFDHKKIGERDDGFLAQFGIGF